LAILGNVSAFAWKQRKTKKMTTIQLWWPTRCISVGQLCSSKWWQWGRSVPGWRVAPVTCFWRLPEDSTPMSKHAAVDTTNCILWSALYGILLRSFVGQYIEYKKPCVKTAGRGTFLMHAEVQLYLNYTQKTHFVPRSKRSVSVTATGMCKWHNGGGWSVKHC
jgi:hypothetical protein